MAHANVQAGQADSGGNGGRGPEAHPVEGFLSDRPFLVLVDSRRRNQGAALASVATHIGAVLLAFALARIIPTPTPAPFLPDLTNYDIVWLAQEGPGGGGGGGGNESPEPPREVELPGEDPVSVPVQKPVELTPPTPETPEPPRQAPLMELPALAMASGAETLPGVMRGLPPTLSTSQGSGSGGGAGTGRGTGIGPGDGSGLGPGSGGGTGGGVYRPGNGVQLPRILREVKPQYTAEAMRAKVQGIVELEAVVLPDGTVGDVRVVHSLDPVFGLDQEAIKAIKQWRFTPGTRLGQPVAVLVSFELSFTLR